ncbi:hypothetical protein [Glycomyces sp. NRRL B-16210]|uniref:hypothetical protein n=1 Tax=Glycomyces sp. NRRL B-16210 TaxID=1463821 RepID=UPI0004C06381|nr:hypothetical protein [Glycomyces sp. NRRL B-16210]
MIVACLVTCLTGLLSAFLPVTPVEPYLIGLVATTGYGAVGLGVAAAVGQTAGKTVIFLGARGALRSARLREWVEKIEKRRAERKARKLVDRADGPVRRWFRGLGRPFGAAGKRLTELLARPALTLPILFLSSLTGLPPLFATSIYIASTRVRTTLFVLVCFAGRAGRFIAVAFAPQLFL